MAVKKAEQWATGVKYDANNIYPAANYGETRNATRISGAGNSGFANKTEDVFSLLSTSSISVCVRPSPTTSLKAKDVEGIGDVDLVDYFEVGATYYFNKTCPPMLTTRLTKSILTTNWA